MTGLRGFIDEHAEAFLHVRKPVPIAHVGAVSARAAQPVVFEHLEEHPGWQLADNLFIDEPAAPQRSKATWINICLLGWRLPLAADC